jgi:hypothetical protein
MISVARGGKLLKIANKIGSLGLDDDDEKPILKLKLA